MRDSKFSGLPIPADIDRLISFFEIIDPIKEAVCGENQDNSENISTIQLDDDTTGTCDMCGKQMIFEHNLSGLVIYGKFFACEKCCQDASKDELNNWTESKMASPKDVKPIALWLMQEKNKTQLFEK